MPKNDVPDDGAQFEPAVDPSPAAKPPWRKSQRKLLIFAFIVLALGGGKIFLDRQAWWQALTPDRPEFMPQNPRSFAFAQTPPSADGFNPIQVVPGPYEPIIDAPSISAEEAGKTMGDAELVLGVVVGDEARAYPINMLTGPSREIINDTLGGRAIAATW